MLTGLPCVHDETGVVEGRPLDQAVAVSFDLAGITDLRLNHHDGDGTIGDVAAVLQDADAMLTHLAGDEGDTWEEEGGGLRSVGEKGELLINFSTCICELPMWLLANLFSRQGSSRPDGAWMLAVRRLKSVSLMSREKSAAEPSLT